MNIGPNIKRFRRDRGMTLVALARRLDTHPSNVRRWETSSVSPRWETVVRIAEALEVPVEDLAAGEDTRGPGRMREVTSGHGLAQMRRLPTPDRDDSQGILFSAAPFEDAREDTLHAQTTRMADTHERRALEYRALSRFLRHPRFRALRESIAKLPDDLTQAELAALSEVVEEFLAQRRQAGEK
jgi:transcriptional regulator with XRE-family HTH domain